MAGFYHSLGIARIYLPASLYHIIQQKCIVRWMIAAAEAAVTCLIHRRSHLQGCVGRAIITTNSAIATSHCITFWNACSRQERVW
jgi:hypothetical protein